MTDEGRLVGGGQTLLVNADGTIDAIEGSGARSRAPFAFEAVPAHGRRTAVLVLAAVMPMFLSAAMRESSSAAPEERAP